MLEKFKSYLLFGILFCGIEHTHINGMDVSYVTVQKKKKNSVDISEQFEVNKIEGLNYRLKKNQHASLIINTEQVLTKKIESFSNKDIELVFRAFPNIDLEQFYYEILNQDSSCFVAICRKDYVSELILKYSKNGIVITDFYLGNLITSSVCEFINQPTFDTSNSLVQKKDGLIDSITLDGAPNQIEYNINGLKTNNTFMLSLCGGLMQILNGYNPLTNALKEKESLLSEFKQLQFFNVFLKFGLGIIFMALLINYFVFNHYFNGVKELQAVNTYNNTTSQKIITLKKEVDSIQKLAEDMLQIDSSKSSFFINDIMQSLPSSILLSDLNYQPLTKAIKENDLIVNELKTILISGTSNDSDTFSNWLSDLSKKSWASNVEILDYNDENSSLSNFSIKLSIANDL